MAGRRDDAAEFAIRTFRPRDRDAVVGLWDRCGLLVAHNDPDRDIALWRASPNGKIFLGVAGRGVAGGRIVATVCAGHDGHRGNFYNVAVDPEAEGRGFGRRMMRHAEAWLADRGVAKANVMIRETNHAVHGFYRAIGYEDTPRLVLGRWLTGDGRPPGGRDAATISSTVTYLEMTARPARPAAPLPRGVRAAFLRARRPGVDFYRYLYDRVGEAWFWYERRAMDDATLGAIVDDDRVEIYVLYVDGVPAGFAELDRRAPPDLELAYLGLLPAFIGQGLGAYLLGSAVEIAWSHEPRRLRVQTNTLDHPKALALYQRMGFKPYRQEERTYPDPRRVGLIPRSGPRTGESGP